MGHSMGGLVARSAESQGAARSLSWRDKLSHMVFLGSPHHGAPLEQGGNLIQVIFEQSPYLAPFNCLGDSRSDGIRDLRFGYLLDEDWKNQSKKKLVGSHKKHVGLPEDVRCFFVGASIANGKLLGDGLVPLNSALGKHRDLNRHLEVADEDKIILKDTNHLDLLSHRTLTKVIKDWMVG